MAQRRLCMPRGESFVVADHPDTMHRVLACGFIAQQRREREREESEIVEEIEKEEDEGF